MADYRQYCGFCGNEVCFGSHKPTCEGQARVRAAEAERREWEKKMREALAELTDDQVVEALVEYELRAKALEQELGFVEKHIMAVKDEARYREDGHKMLERVREELKARG